MRLELPFDLLPERSRAAKEACREVVNCRSCLEAVFANHLRLIKVINRVEILADCIAVLSHQNELNRADCLVLVASLSCAKPDYRELKWSGIKLDNL